MQNFSVAELLILTISIVNPACNYRLDVSGGHTLRNMFGGVVDLQVLC